MSSTLDVPSVRRHLTERQAETVHRLSAAGLEEIRARGYDGLTVRNVARRAGVAPATAYTYFASKDHLVTEIFWQRLDALGPHAIDSDLPAPQRICQAVMDICVLIAAEPHLAAACTTAMLAPDPDVARVRDRIGAELYRRMSDALGATGDPAVVDALGLALSGALMHAGMGYFGYDEVADRIAEVARLITELAA